MDGSHRLDWVLLRDVVKRSLERSRVKGLVDEAVRARARGVPTEEARDILVEELLAHGCDVPPQPLLDLRLAVIERSRTWRGRAELQVEAVTLLGALGARVARLVRGSGTEERSDDVADEPGGADADGAHWARRLLGDVPVDTHRTAEVALGPGAESWIGERTAGAVSFMGCTILHVQLRPGGDGGVAVELDGREIGIVAAVHAASLAALFDEAPELDHVRIPCIRSRAADATWRLHVFLPKEAGGGPR